MGVEVKLTVSSLYWAAHGLNLSPSCSKQRYLLLQLQSGVKQVPNHLGNSQQLWLSPFKNALSVLQTCLMVGKWKNDLNSGIRGQYVPFSLHKLHYTLIEARSLWRVSDQSRAELYYPWGMFNKPKQKRSDALYSIIRSLCLVPWVQEWDEEPDGALRGGRLGIRGGRHGDKGRLFCPENTDRVWDHIQACKELGDKTNCHIDHGAMKRFSASTDVIPGNWLVLILLSYGDWWGPYPTAPSFLSWPSPCLPSLPPSVYHPLLPQPLASSQRWI